MCLSVDLSVACVCWLTNRLLVVVKFFRLAMRVFARSVVDMIICLCV